MKTGPGGVNESVLDMTTCHDRVGAALYSNISNT
jgi:hypothetical protein